MQSAGNTVNPDRRLGIDEKITNQVRQRRETPNLIAMLGTSRAREWLANPA